MRSTDRHFLTKEAKAFTGLKYAHSTTNSPRTTRHSEHDSRERHSFRATLPCRNRASITSVHAAPLRCARRRRAHALRTLCLLERRVASCQRVLEVRESTRTCAWVLRRWPPALVTGSLLVPWRRHARPLDYREWGRSTTSTQDGGSHHEIPRRTRTGCIRSARIR